MVRLYAVLATVVLAIGLGAMWLLTRGAGSDDQFAQCRSSQIAGGTAAIGGPFELINGEGQTVTDADVITEPTLVYFGYTFCPDVCPFDMSRNAEAVDILAERGQSVTPLFISIDPDRDTPEVVADYAFNMGGKTIALTGSAEQVKAASQAYKTYYKAHDKSDEYYLVDHSTFTYLMTPETGFLEFFNRNDSAEQMADKVGCFLDKL
ncbi:MULTISPECIES: SCO family protein [unclassified Ruegeria]|uniref:SCO family protein n=1 Tax=unclassified Ruegeria TaxID=2625375 RepID=UPI001ADB3E32|nr:MULTISPECIES: SCO family protein [unclassified Ruegeria]MBO9412241.1 SCO family protein [Ruegeria sp. R8_1]MBO9417453.1 SCO family protein [Ruegeria sp. R8_2]